MAKNRIVSLSSLGIKYKLKIAFYLMAILPMLVCVYLVANYILPKVGLKVDIIMSIVISMVIALAGFLLIKEVFDRILSVTSEAKLIASGNIDRKIGVVHDDEIGDLGGVLNQLTMRIKNNMDELKSYSVRTTEINIEIQKRVLMLSNLLEIGSLVSQGAKLEDIIKITIEKSRLLANSDIVYLLFREEKKETFYIKAADGINSNYLLNIKINPERSIFSRIIKTNAPLLLDNSNLFPRNIVDDFNKDFRLKNTLALPLYLRGKIIGILGIGNNRELFIYRKEDIELLDVFGKQLAIAVENDLLQHRIERLEIKDILTGVYNETFIENRLEEEIKRAVTYQRPCAYILLNIDGFKIYTQKFGSLQAEFVLKKVSSLIKDSVSEIDRVGRVGDNEFAIVLPEKNKRNARETAEMIRKKIEFSFSEETNADKIITVTGAISENPLDGIDAKELIAKAKKSLELAKEQGGNQIFD